VGSFVPKTEAAGDNKQGDFSLGTSSSRSDALSLGWRFKASAAGSNGPRRVATVDCIHPVQSSLRDALLTHTGYRRSNADLNLNRRYATKTLPHTKILSDDKQRLIEQATTRCLYCAPSYQHLTGACSARHISGA
jgi:hypothetical protein